MIPGAISVRCVFGSPDSFENQVERVFFKKSLKKEDKEEVALSDPCWCPLPLLKIL